VPAPAGESADGEAAGAVWAGVAGDGEAAGAVWAGVAGDGEAAGAVWAGAAEAMAYSRAGTGAEPAGAEPAEAEPAGAAAEGAVPEGTAPEGTPHGSTGSATVARVLTFAGEAAAGANPHSASTEETDVVTGMEGGIWAAAGS